MRDTKSNAFRLATTLGGAICAIALVASPIAFDSATPDLDGNSLTLTGIADRVMAEAVAGTAPHFDVVARIPHHSFPGGPLLLRPIAVLGAL